MKKIKILFTIVFSYFLASLFNHNLFLASSPKLNPFLAKNITAFLVENKLPGDNEHSKSNKSNNKEYVQLSRGIYAKELDNRGQYVFLKEDDVEWVIYKFNVKGKVIEIKVPKEQQPPSQEVVEKLYQ